MGKFTRPCFVLAFQKRCFFCLISTFRKALRDKSGTGNAFAIDAALKFIIPLFCCQCGLTKYEVLMHWHSIRTNYIVTVTPLVAEAI